MPDETITPDASSPTSSELEKLIAEAEQQQATKTPAEISQVQATQCNHDGSDVPSRRWCRSCKKLICPFCWSVLDANYCVACMQNVDLKITPHIALDDDGVAHVGRQIVPSNGYNLLRWVPDGKTTAKSLSDMSRTELEEYVDDYKHAVHDAERALDFRRIRLGSGQMELEERKDQERRRLRADKTKFPVRTVSLDPATGKQVTRSASTAKLLEMMKMLEALAKLKATPTPKVSS